jgi:hypothetical protein
MNKSSAPSLSVGYLLYVIGVAVGTVLSAPATAIGAENVITCQPNQDTSIEYGDIVNCSIETINGSDLIRFSGSIGETIMVQTFRLGGTGDPLVDLFAPDGTRIGGGLNLFQVTLQQSGPHTIMVTEFTNDATVDYALTVQCVSGDCTIVPIPDVSGCINLKGAPLAGRRVNLLQSDEPTQTTTTDVRGCYEFATIRSGKKFRVIIRRPRVP